MPEPGVPRLDGRAFVAVVRYGDIVVCHDTFADHWFKVNAITDLDGAFVETTPKGGAPLNLLRHRHPMVRRAPRSWPSSCSLTCWSAAMTSPRGCTTNGSRPGHLGGLVE
jgi:hypothetical protein